MATVTLTREFDVPAETVRDLVLADVPAFIEASGFDSVEQDGDTFVVSRQIGLATFELTLAVVSSPSVLALDQVEGFFDEMWTEYRVEPTAGGCEMTATTEFTLGGVLGPVLDETMITGKRHNEFELQFEYVAERIMADA